MHRERPTGKGNSFESTEQDFAAYLSIAWKKKKKEKKRGASIIQSNNDKRGKTVDFLEGGVECSRQIAAATEKGGRKDA